MNKYGNKQYQAFGRWFDSKKEGVRYIELKTLQMGGEISELECQKSFELIPTRYYGKKCERGCKYIVDFWYYDKQRKEYVAEEIKGYETDSFKIKKKLFLEKYVAKGVCSYLEIKEKPVYYEKK